jgi:hypothetical protein
MEPVMTSTINFKELWPQISWFIDDMRSGVAFWEGYILARGASQLEDSLQSIIKRAKSYSYEYSCWSNDADESLYKSVSQYRDDEWISFFHNDLIIILHLDYTTFVDGTELVNKLMISKNQDDLDIEVICYREPILESPNPKSILKKSYSELIDLFHIFRGYSVYVSSDNLDYPVENHPETWIRVG